MISRPAFARFPAVLFVLSLAFSMRAFAATYYVDYAGGADSNNGTDAAAAWQHCPGDPAASGVPAAASLVPGDTILFKGGVSYVLTGSTGIALRWNGVTSSPITYDGNSAGTWGVGRAKFTDNFGGAGLSAFVASAAVDSVVFQSLAFVGLGGAASLPADNGAAVSPRFGGGILFAAGVTNTTVSDCVFAQLGYAYNQKPMAATSLAGTAITLRGVTNINITSCDFSGANLGVDMESASLASVTISNCAFHDSIVWPINAAPGASGLLVFGCVETSNDQFDRGVWSGYGDSPHTSVKSVVAGAPVTLTASAIAIPSASFQWLKNGQVISGATNAELSFASIAAADAGIYMVTATNSAGTSSSNEEVLNVTAASTTTTTPTTTAPVITTQPISQTAAPLASVTFTVAASGSPTPSYQWYRNGVTFTGWTGATLTLASVSSSDAGNYWAVASNSAGSATSSTATLTVTSTVTTSSATAPIFTTQPVSQTVMESSSVSFTVAASGSPAPSYQWLRNGTPLAGATSATLTLSNVSATDAATYSATATNSAGSVDSAGATLTVTKNTNVAPVFTLQPVSLKAAAKSTVTFSAGASGSPAPAYQWYKNGTAITNATATKLTLTNVNKGDAGTYTVVARNVAGSATSNGAVLTISTAKALSEPVAGDGAAVADSRIVNLSVRANAGTGDDALIVGFVVSGDTDKSLLIRGTGPALNAFGVNGTLADPMLTLYSARQAIAANDDWNASTDGSAISAVSARVGAFALPESGVDSALLAAVSPGVYTGQITGKSEAAGVAMIELYDAAPASTARLANVAVRTTMQANSDAPVIGFVIAGEAKTLLIRAVGPGLNAFGVNSAVGDPKISLFAGSELVGENDNWSGSAELVTAFERAGAFPLSDSSSKDAALVFTAPAGAYTAVVSGVSNSEGTVLFEVYELP